MNLPTFSRYLHDSSMLVVGSPQSQTLPDTFIDAIKRETWIYFDNENKLTGQLTCQKFNQTWRHTKKGVLAKY